MSRSGFGSALTAPFRGLARRMTAWAWSRRLAAGGTRTFMHEPVVRRRINARITGDPDLWPMDYFARRCAGRVFARGLSLGCGEGALERDVRRRGLVGELEGLELAAELVELARAKAAEEGLKGLTYRQADLGEEELPSARHDIVLVHQALHHFENLDFCLSQARRSLRPGGLFYVDEYVGPSRNHWSAARLEPLRQIYAGLPPAVRRARKLRAPIDKLDPSEAIRSAEILYFLEKHFEIVERRDYGGQILAVLYPNLERGEMSQAEWETLLTRLLDAEEELARAGLPPFYTWILARPRPPA